MNAPREAATSYDSVRGRLGRHGIGETMSDRALGGRYAIQDKIGTGGMAVVYRGLDQVLGRTVAVKTMLPQFAGNSSFAAHFKQKAQADRKAHV